MKRCCNAATIFHKKRCKINAEKEQGKGDVAAKIGAKKEPEPVWIIAIDGSDILKHGIVTRKDGKLYPDAFRGVLDESVDTPKTKGIFKRHKEGLLLLCLDTSAVVKVHEYDLKPNVPAISPSGRQLHYN